MKYEKQEQIPYDYKWSQINARLSESAINSYNQYTNDYNNAKSDDAKEFFLDQRHKYLVLCFKDYENNRLETIDNKPIDLQAKFNQGIAKNILAEPGTPDARVLYTAEKVDSVSPTIKVCTSDATKRFLLYRDNKPVCAIVVLLKNESFGAKQNIITTAYTDINYQNQGLGRSLLNFVQKQFKSLVVSNELTESGIKLIKPKQSLSL